MNACLSTEQALEAANALLPLVRSTASETERQRSLSSSIMDQLAQRGLARLAVPRAFGGAEVSFKGMAQCIELIAQADPSTGWFYSLLLIHNWWIAHYPQKAQEEIWGGEQGLDTYVASSFIPQPGKPIDGGYLIEGKWSWSSGVDHASYALLRTYIPSSDGTPETLFCLVPRTDYHIIDDWFSIGLRGSGSKSILIDHPVFVPAYRSLSLAAFRRCETPGAALYGGIYRLPPFATFPLFLLLPLLGTAWGAYHLYRDHLSTLRHRKIDTYSHVQIALGELHAQLTAASLIVEHALARLDEAQQPQDEEHVTFQARYCYAAHLCLKATERIFTQSGGSALQQDHLLQKYWRDAHAMALHAGLNSLAAWEDFGRVELGLGSGAQPRLF